MRSMCQYSYVIKGANLGIDTDRVKRATKDMCLEGHMIMKAMN